MKLYDKLVELENLKTDKNSGVARKRGFDFEKLVREIFLRQGLLSIVKQTGYHTSDNSSEQIDGVINFEGKIFLLEAKWDENLAASSLYEFIGKVENKFFGTLGIYVSYHQLSDNFINSLRKGRKQNVIVIHGDDVKLLFSKEINLKGFLRYAIEKLSFDNLPYISVSEFFAFTDMKSKNKMDFKVNDNNVRDFIKSNITVSENRDFIDMEIEFEKLTPNEKANTYLILFKHSKTLLKFSFPVPATYRNLRTFYSIYRPDFAVDELQDLPDQFYSKYIFEEPQIYLLNFIDVFLYEFPKINKEAKKIFEKNIVELYKKSDWEIENALTHILEKYEKCYSKEILKALHKLYINFYYSSSRSSRFSQKSYAISLLKSRRIAKETVFEWIEEKLKYDLDLYEDDEKFNLFYFSKTYIDLGFALNLTEKEWDTELNKIYKKYAK